MGLNLTCIVQRFLYDGAIPGHRASAGVARESPHHRSPSPSPCVPAQHSGSEVVELSEERKYSDDADYHQLLKDYRKVQALLSSSTMNAEMLRSELDAARDALQVSKNEAS